MVSLTFFHRGYTSSCHPYKVEFEMPQTASNKAVTNLN